MRKQSQIHYYGECGNGGIPTDYKGKRILREIYDHTWRKAKWSPEPAVVYRDKSGTVRFMRPVNVSEETVAEFIEDLSAGETVAGAWDHDHCIICSWMLEASEEPEHNMGYVDETDRWLCCKCHFAMFGSKPTI